MSSRVKNKKSHRKVNRPLHDKKKVKYGEK